MGGACITYRDEKCVQYFGRNTERKRRRWEGNVEAYVKEIGYEVWARYGFSVNTVTALKF
jgi:hypothetical protein